MVAPTLISIVIPLHNEEATLPELTERLLQSFHSISASFELLFINDGSTDRTLDRIRELSRKHEQIRYLSLSRNFGHQTAVSAGLDHCRGEAVVIMDGDLQDSPELIPELYETYRKGYDIVYAKRTRRNGETWFKKATATLFYRILKRITSFEIPLDTGDFRLIDRKVVDVLKEMPERNKFLRGQIAWMGFESTFVEFERQERKHGRSHYPFRKMLDFALDGITSLSDRPLRLVTQAGFTVSLLSVLILLYALWSHFVLARTIDGWTSLIITVSFLGGVQLFSIGIIGEYISRINRNVLGRPLYIVEEKGGFSETAPIHPNSSE